MSYTTLFLTKVLPFLVFFDGFVHSLDRYQQYGMGKLVFVNILFRHGDRTPIDPYPNDPYGNASYWPVAFGQLTNTGKMQEYQLGLWLRRRYDHLLTERYDPDIVRVHSTDVDRTLMSAASNLAAMYRPNHDQRWNPNLDWQPIPIHTEPEILDKVLAAKFPCPAYDLERERVLRSPEIMELNRRYATVYKVLNQNTGLKVETLDDILNVYNNLFIENLYNLTLPAWTQGVFPQPMEEAAAYSFALPTWTPKLARLKAGLLINDMVQHMKHKKENRKGFNYNVWIYSAHDLTVANVLNALRVFDPQNPPYSATVLLELWQDDSGGHSVTLLYRNSTEREPYLLTLPGCSTVCPLDQFISYVTPLVPQDWDSECQVSLLTHTLSNSNFTVIALANGLILLLLLIFAGLVYYKRQRRPTHCSPYLIPWDFNTKGGVSSISKGKLLWEPLRT